jgi:predicted RNA-binding Zn-ribbon protein involved in translation (DUF1610 family)
MSEPVATKVTYDSTPWHVCPTTGSGSALRFKGGARDGAEVTCPACGTRLVYRKPKGAAAYAEQGGRTHF